MEKCGCNSNGIQINGLKTIHQFLKLDLKKERWMESYKSLKTGLRIPVVKTKLSFFDTLGGFKARWGVNRMNYQIQPGIYAIGRPDENSEILVTANYKLTFDALRKELKGFNLWILVLDTKGINVWCAAGKGTFGTQELIQKIQSTQLNKIVNHKKIILPQLGAVGVSAHKIQKETGFQVIYGPVLAKDIPEYLKNGKIKSEQMKSMPFKIYHRLVLIPIELIGARKIIFALLAVSALFFFIENKTLKPELFISLFCYLGPVITGAILTPLLLPFIPFRALSLKGWLLGLTWPVLCYLVFQVSWKEAVYFSLIFPQISAFLALSFTGATTYTSLSGVKKEMKIFIPLMIGLVSAGLILKILFLIKLI